MNGITLTRMYYRYQQDNGTPASRALRERQAQISKNHYAMASGTGLFPAMPISVQDINSNSRGLNSFDLVRDVSLVDGYERYENEAEMDQQFVRYLRAKALPNNGLRAQRAWTERHDESVALSNKLYDADPTLLKRNPLYVEMDDAYNLQDLKRQATEMLPLGYISLDYLDDSDDSVFRPFISGFMPPRLTYVFYAPYQIQVAWVKTARFKDFEQVLRDELGFTDNVLENVFSHFQAYSLAPTKDPSVLASFMLESATVSPQTSLIDMNVRLANLILKQKVGTDANFRVGVQMFRHKQVNVISAASGASAMMITTIFMAAASFYCMLKYGFHVVQDRQAGVRKQLYLNGVPALKYWLATIGYNLVIALVVQVIIMFLAYFVFQIGMIYKMDFGCLALLSFGAAFGSVALSLFLSSFFTKTSMFQIAIIIVLIVSVLVVMFGGSDIQE